MPIVFKGQPTGSDVLCRHWLEFRWAQVAVFHLGPPPGEAGYRSQWRIVHGMGLHAIERMTALHLTCMQPMDAEMERWLCGRVASRLTLRLTIRHLKSSDTWRGRMSTLADALALASLSELGVMGHSLPGGAEDANHDG
jgi:hypothetical protein